LTPVSDRPGGPSDIVFDWPHHIDLTVRGSLES